MGKRRMRHGHEGQEIEKFIKDVLSRCRDRNEGPGTATTTLLGGDGEILRLQGQDARVAQHQMVYAALKGNMGGVLHALQLTTVAKD